ncbi:KIR protein [Plasmodium coatneyi]|uniref:KIR protein n=1 Tax=Plasmodium coatneyi TaxID=208452 RepID=A0A1B1E248_9APIC|nr:KIR protein [Plasmodium coatneyi]ANQ09108.1 KIR protein [Plasmodium coatneyi]
MVTKGQCKLEDLPSKQIYTYFNNDGHKCANSDSKAQQISSILKDKIRDFWIDGDRNYAQRITSAWCLVSTVSTKGETQCDKTCDYFYFWLGDILCNKWGSSSSFKDTMREIYNKLNEQGAHCTYNDMHNTVSRDIFSKRKIIFDYYYDYRTIWKDLKSFKEYCTQVYKSYLDAATTAYRQVQANCGTGNRNNNDDFCKRFKEMFEDNDGKIPKPSELQSKAMREDPASDNEGDEANLDSCLKQLFSVVAASSFGHKETSSHHSPPSQLKSGAAAAGNSTNTVVPIVSSAVTGISLPAAVTFFLYKVITIILAKMNNNNILFIFT